jgi:hypothetical protein
MALRFSGRLNVIQVIPSLSVSTSTQVYSFFLTIGALLQKLVYQDFSIRVGKINRGLIERRSSKSLDTKAKLVDVLSFSQAEIIVSTTTEARNKSHVGRFPPNEWTRRARTC